jgi:dienelactone hydrolase
MNDDRRDALYSLLGDLPAPRERASARLLGREDRPYYELERLLIDTGGSAPAPAYFIHPLDAEPPWPTVLYCHSHGGDYASGKEELLLGRGYLRSPPYAEELARAGYAALCIDQWCFGERRGALGLATESAAAKYFLWQGACLWGMMVFDSLGVLDYLRSRPDVDPGRIVSLGMSMGASMAIWAAALNAGVAACVDICGQVDGESLIRDGGLDRHGIYYYVPGLLKRFSMADIDAMIAPRPHLAIAGNRDALTPSEGLDRIGREVASRYAESGCPETWRLLRLGCGHEESAEARLAVLDFLRVIRDEDRADRPL